MGIKGIYGEIGPGERVSLSKLAIEKLEKEGRPLRIAIDVSIWQFQTLSGQGGSNPAIRTFYYRLVRLLSFSVQPLFVFDGPNKPPFKRGKKTGQHGACVPNLNTKQMLELFGFPYHTAHGEAEAECALLQREGLVDAVLSEDVDTLMFGCGLTFRNWSSEGTRGNKSPTHVSVYSANATKAGRSGLDREGMVLVALMSGGDYIQEGIPHCGIKVACEAARAGFGKSLCKFANNDTAGIADWRNNLAHEIRTNESGYFRVKHKTLVIPENFPNREVLGYYTNPIVSSASKIQRLKNEIIWNGEIDIQGLRQFVASAFDWSNKIGARKFIRNLAPALLVYKLRLRGDRRDSGYGDLVLTAVNEMELVRAICTKRNHFSVDGIDELRVIYSPIDIVGIDLDAEHDGSMDYSRSGLATNDADDQDLEIEDDVSRSPGKRGPSIYDPTQPDKLWIPATIAKLGVPLKVEDYEESLKNPMKFLKAKALVKKAAAGKGKKQTGAMDKFVSISKSSKESENFTASRSTSKSTLELDLPPVFLAPSLEQSTPEDTGNRGIRNAKISSRTSTGSIATKPARKPARNGSNSKPQPNTNPWTIAKTTTSPQSRPNVNKTIILPSSSPIAKFKPPSPCYISSSPASPYPPPAQPQRHFKSRTTAPQSPTPPSAQQYLSSSPPTASSHSLPSAQPIPSPSSAKKHIHSPIPSPTFSSPEFILPDTVTISRSRSRQGAAKAKSKSQEPSTPSKSKTNTKTRDPVSPSLRKKISPAHEHYHDYPPSTQPHFSSFSPKNPARRLDFSSPSTKMNIDIDIDIDDGTEREQERRREKERSSSLEDLPCLVDLSALHAIPTSAQSSRPTTTSTSTSSTSMGDISFHHSQSQSKPKTKSKSSLVDASSASASNSNSTSNHEMKRRAQKKKFIMLRQSLAGAWKEIDADPEADTEAEDEDDGILGAGSKGVRSTGARSTGKGEGQEQRRKARWRYSEVEIVDLSQE